MNFTNFLHKLYEASGAITPKKPSEPQKDRMKGRSADERSKDAARKRAERAKEVPHERKSKQELVKEVLLVRTKSGKIQLIFKDSYNKSQHEILNKTEMTMEEARQAVKDPKFEQTRASQLLFGNVKEKEKGEKKEPKEKEEKKEGGSKKTTVGAEKEKASEEGEPKARRMSKEEIFKSMSQMSGEQLAQMPQELRQEYFKMMRRPPANSDFDNMSYESLSVKFNLNPISSLPYNQQVLNALMFLAKIKAGAGEQEMQTYGAVAPAALEFTRSAFFTARKILSQIGDECIQNLVSTVEMGTKAVNAEGAVDMQCGNYRFKVSAGGEMSLSTSQFDQSNKSFKGLIAGALMQALSNPETIQKDPKLAEVMQKGQETSARFATTLVPEAAIESIKQNPELLKQLQKMDFKDSAGNSVGPVLDEDGNLNPLISLDKYRAGWIDSSKSLLKGAGSAQKSPLKAALASVLLKSYLRGDNMIPPEMAPNHLVTINGIFPMSDDYFNTIASNAQLDVKPSKTVINSSNVSNYKSSAAEMLKKFRTIVEAKDDEKGQEKKMSLKDVLVGIDTINPMELMVSNIMNNSDINFNASLLPGFSPDDLNSVEYNYLKIGKKTIKIPVDSTEKIANQFIEESPVLLNDIIIESLSDNDVLDCLVESGLITSDEGLCILWKESIIAESNEEQSVIEKIYYNAWNRLYENPDKFFLLLYLLQEEYKRDYKKEYKNYHGKPKQRKERAARTAARELMIKKGRAKKGDGKDIDHKKALRNGGSKGINNLRVRDRSSNRSDNGHEEGETQKKGSWK